MKFSLESNLVFLEICKNNASNQNQKWILINSYYLILRLFSVLADLSQRINLLLV